MRIANDNYTFYTHVTNSCTITINLLRDNLRYLQCTGWISVKVSESLSQKGVDIGCPESLRVSCHAKGVVPAIWNYNKQWKVLCCRFNHRLRKRGIAWKHESTHVIFPWLYIGGRGLFLNHPCCPPAPPNPRKHFYLFEALYRTS